MIFKNGLLFTKNGWHLGGFEVTEDGKFGGFYFDAQPQDGIDLEGKKVIPGLIDVHIHGAMGADFSDGDPEGLRNMARYLLKEGITSFTPASMTLPYEILESAFKTGKALADENPADCARIMGVHMEGPYFSEKKKGAQNGAYIHKPDAEMFLRLQDKANGLIKLVDIAPEVEGAMECIEAIYDKVRVSVAHTDADFEVAEEAFAKGACHVTHLYNAMRPYTHRAPGVIGAACDNQNVMVELICDGVHSHPATVRTTFKMFGDDRVVLISDSMMACGLEDGQYTLGGQAVTVKGNLATLTELGNIAGSVTNLMKCMRKAVKEMQIPLASAVKCATINPAKAIGIYDNYGSLTPGKTADVVLLDKDLEIQYIIKSGKIVFSK